MTLGHRWRKTQPLIKNHNYFRLIFSNFGFQNDDLVTSPTMVPVITASFPALPGDEAQHQTDSASCFNSKY